MPLANGDRWFVEIGEERKVLTRVLTVTAPNTLGFRTVHLTNGATMEVHAGDAHIALCSKVPPPRPGFR
jgi:hypothetical protein